VYTQHILSGLSLARRLSAATYISWLAVEGLIALAVYFAPWTQEGTTSVELELPMMYFVGSSLLVILLHSYVGGRVARTSLRIVPFVHQVTLIALSLRKFAVVNSYDLGAWSGFRAVVLMFCCLMETGSFATELGKVLLGIE
jgi:hypothetical protein